MKGSTLNKLLNLGKNIPLILLTGVQLENGQKERRLFGPVVGERIWERQRY